MSAIIKPDLSRLDLAIQAYGGLEGFKRFLTKSDPDYVLRLGYDWEFLARPKQLSRNASADDPVKRRLAQSGAWATWHVRCGRGWGKSFTGAQWIRSRVESGAARRIALVGATAADVRDVMVEGPSGILAVSPPWCKPKYEPSKRRLTWPNGAVATTYSADEPRSLRGPEHDSAWCDELAHWKYLEDAWDNLQFGLRRGDPKCIVTSSPRALAFLRELEKEKDTITTVGNTLENAHNLPPKYLKKILAKYAGTRLGRQEIDAEILTDNPAAMWTIAMLERAGFRVQDMPDDVIRLVIGVDPAVSSDKKKSDETGIVGGGLCECRCKGHPEQHAFIFDDRSDVYKPDEWGRKVVDFYEETMADLVVAEVNNGGELVERNIRATKGGERIAYQPVHASKGKEMRHEPVANLYSQGRVHHVGRLSRLEDQQTQWDRTQGKSPDRLDALTIVVTELMLGGAREPAEVGVTVIG